MPFLEWTLDPRNLPETRRTFWEANWRLPPGRNSRTSSNVGHIGAALRWKHSSLPGESACCSSLLASSFNGNRWIERLFLGISALSSGTNTPSARFWTVFSTLATFNDLLLKARVAPTPWAGACFFLDRTRVEGVLIRTREEMPSRWAIGHIQLTRYPSQTDSKTTR